MVQILRIENPLLVPGLKPAQRLCYFNAMSHFLYALPRLIFLTAPLIYLIFGHDEYSRSLGCDCGICAAAPGAVEPDQLAHAGAHRHSFWNEIYETVLAPYILLPTLLALINPRLGRFNVTAKGAWSRKDSSMRASPGHFCCCWRSISSACSARFPGCSSFPLADVPAWLQFVNWPAQLYDGEPCGNDLGKRGVDTVQPDDSGSCDGGIVGEPATPADGARSHGGAVGCDPGRWFDDSGHYLRPFRRRRSHPDGRRGESQGRRFNQVRLSAAGRNGDAAGEDRRHRMGMKLRAQFDPLSLQEDEALTMLLYSRADAWLGLGEARETDMPLRSMGRIVRLALRGLSHTAGGSRGRKEAPESKLVTSIAPVVLLGLLAGVSGAVYGRRRQITCDASGRVATAGSTPNGMPPAAAGTFDSVFTLSRCRSSSRDYPARHRRVPLCLFLRGEEPAGKTATMKLRYHLSPGLLPGVSQLNVSLNGTMFASLPLQLTRSSGDQTGLLEATLNLPTDLLVHDNQLTFEFIGHYAPQCEDPSNSTLWAQWIRTRRSNWPVRFCR